MNMTKRVTRFNVDFLLQLLTTQEPGRTNLQNINMCLSLCHLIPYIMISAYVRKNKLILRFNVASLPYCVWYWLSRYIACLFSIKQKELARLKCGYLSQFLMNKFRLLSNYQDSSLWRIPWEYALLENLIWTGRPIFMKTNYSGRWFFSSPPYCFIVDCCLSSLCIRGNRTTDDFCHF